MKRLFSLLVACAMCLGAVAQQRPTVAVVLSGGGAKGVAHISALRAVEEAGIPIDIVCGTSMGSLIGALYCVGYSTDFLDSLVRNQDWASLLSDRTDPADLTLYQRREQNTYALIRGISSDRPQQGGLIRGRNLNALFRQLCSNYLDSISFDSLPIRFACVATDIVTNTEVDFRSGYLIRAMRASMAIPGVFTPVRMGDKVLIDGGLRNNYPADLARRMGADIIIGVSVQGESLSADEISDATSVLSQIIDVNCRNKLVENVAMSDVMMHVDVSGYSAASFTPSAIDSLLARGSAEAARHRDELLALAARIAASGSTTLKRHAKTAMPDSSLAVATRRHRAVPSQRPADSPIASVGFRFDTEEMGAIQLNAKVPLPTALPMGIAGTLRLGRLLEGKLEYTLFPRGFTSPSISYTLGRHEVEIYTLGTRAYNVKYRQHNIELAPLNFKVKNFTLRIGLQWDYYDYYGPLLSAGTSAVELHDESFLSYNLQADLNTENHWYFPTSGTRLHAAYAYRTDNMVTYNGAVGINDLRANWRVNIPMGRHLSLQPMVYGRIVMTDDVPPAYLNAVGSEWFGHIVAQQMPFAGIGHTEYVERHFIAAQLQAQYRIKKNHYVLLRLATALHSDGLQDLLAVPDLFGTQIGYSYNTIFGPIDLRLGYSTRTKYPYIYINIGHHF